MGKADITTKSSVAKTANVYNTATKFHHPRSKRNSNFTSRSSHRVNFSAVN